jgi:hypothetical protein
MKISEMTTEDLKKEAAGLFQSVYVFECCGARDIVSLQVMCDELEKRGWISEEVMSLHFVEKTEGEDDE